MSVHHHHSFPGGKNFTVSSGFMREHTAPMDRIAGDSRSTLREYELDFGRVATGSRGSGSAVNYEFKYAADGRQLDLYDKR